MANDFIKTMRIFRTTGHKYLYHYKSTFDNKEFYLCYYERQAKNESLTLIYIKPNEDKK